MKFGRLFMKRQKKTTNSRKRIADEILHQIGGSVILESYGAANQLTGFLEQYTKSVGQLAANPEIKDVMIETKAGDDIRKAQKMDTVMENLVSIANTDTENLLAVWISDWDARV